jgi:hypothetical protein
VVPDDAAVALKAETPIGVNGFVLFRHCHFFAFFRDF